MYGRSEAIKNLCSQKSITFQNKITTEPYSMFHVTWNTFKFIRNQLGTVSAYVM